MNVGDHYAHPTLSSLKPGYWGETTHMKKKHITWLKGETFVASHA